MVLEKAYAVFFSLSPRSLLAFFDVIVDSNELVLTVKNDRF